MTIQDHSPEDREREREDQGFDWEPWNDEDGVLARRETRSVSSLEEFRP
jgi:hypothetical protein